MRYCRLSDFKGDKVLAVDDTIELRGVVHGDKQFELCFEVIKMTSNNAIVNLRQFSNLPQSGILDLIGDFHLCELYYTEALQIKKFYWTAQGETYYRSGQNCLHLGTVADEFYYLNASIVSELEDVDQHIYYDNNEFTSKDILAYEQRYRANKTNEFINGQLKELTLLVKDLFLRLMHGGSRVLYSGHICFTDEIGLYDIMRFAQPIGPYSGDLVVNPWLFTLCRILKINPEALFLEYFGKPHFELNLAGFIKDSLNCLGDEKTLPENWERFRPMMIKLHLINDGDRESYDSLPEDCKDFSEQKVRNVNLVKNYINQLEVVKHYNMTYDVEKNVLYINHRIFGSLCFYPLFNNLHKKFQFVATGRNATGLDYYDNNKQHILPFLKDKLYKDLGIDNPISFTKNIIGYDPLYYGFVSPYSPRQDDYAGMFNLLAEFNDRFLNMLSMQKDDDYRKRLREEDFMAEEFEFREGDEFFIDEYKFVVERNFVHLQKDECDVYNEFLPKTSLNEFQLKYLYKKCFGLDPFEGWVDVNTFNVTFPDYNFTGLTKFVRILNTMYFEKRNLAQATALFVD